MCDWDFIEAALTTHNHWRQRHGVPNLRYNRDLERIAQGWAVHIAQTGQPASSTNLYMRQPVGENIVIRGSKQGEDMSGKVIVRRNYFLSYMVLYVCVYIISYIYTLQKKLQKTRSLYGYTP